MSATATGIPLESGTKLLSGIVPEIWWRAQSRFLTAGCEEMVPGWRFSPVGGTGGQPAPTPGGVALGFVPAGVLTEWAAAHGLRLAMPSVDVSRLVGDKLRLPALAAAAGLGTPRSLRVPARSTVDAAQLFERLGTSQIVVQRAENDLTGAGTRLTSDASELADCLAGWACHDLKLSELVSGLPLTVSGVVTVGGTAVSGISYQLVGYQRLTARWSAHCGNQLVADRELPSGVADRCRETARRLGSVLRRTGFLGMFGADLMATAHDVLVLEINPRVQSVTSLLNAAELDAELLPAPALHVLGFLADEVPPMVDIALPVTTYGQLVVAARTSGRVRALPPEGRWSLAGGTTGEAATWVTGHGVVADIRADEAIVWPLARPGAIVQATDRLYVIQLPVPVVDLDAGGVLTEVAERWLARLDDRTEIEEVGA